MKYFFTKFGFLVCIFFLVASLAYSQGYLKASGTKIVDGNGQEIILRGIGLGGWLLPEGYMIQTSSFANAAWQFQQKVEDLVGKTNSDNFFKLYRANFVTRKDIQKIAAWGFNSIRLPMHFNLLTPQNTPYVYSEEGFATIDSLLQWCEESKLYLILDLHAAPGGQSKDNIADYNPAYLPLWEDPVAQQRTVELWKTIAIRYANKKWIGGYDLLNETAYSFTSSNLHIFRDLFISITNSIRQVDKNHIIFIEGNWYATDFNSLTPPWDDNMAYSFHKYWNATDVGTINYLLTIRSNNNRPLWMGESGENSNQWFTETIKMLEDNNVGWSWWTLKKLEGNNSMMNVVKPVEYDNLLKYWKGQADKPSVDYAVDALTKFANALKFDNCILNNGVIDAMFRQVKSNETAPFGENSVPGTIYASDYDYGPQGYAYSDIDYKNTTGSAGGAAWNSGGLYRNDGVDIGRNYDFFSNGYYVGWINKNEQLYYTLNVKQSGIYNVEFRLAANSGGAQIAMLLDGALLGSLVNIASTGGWTNWQSVNQNNVSLTAGRHLFSVKFSDGGFNLSYIKFDLVSTDIKDEKNLPDKFELMQNFPNPFNPETNIKYSLPKPGFVTLKIFDLLGREVALLVNEFQQEGFHAIKFSLNQNGLAHLPSGMYLYKIKSGEFSDTKKMILMK